jgi:sirohydrochlorin cobaltochelatase
VYLSEKLLLAARGSLGDFLSAAMEEGFCKLGQVEFGVSGEKFWVRHVDDAGVEGLEIFSNSHDAIAIAATDADGNFRPLKTAPDLRRGWELEVGGLGELRLALDFLYPAALGNWRAALRGENLSFPLSETLGRQTGMYRITAKLDSAEALGIAKSLCSAGCLRRILWTVDGTPPRSTGICEAGEIPLLCTDACSLFLGEARRTVKSRAVNPAG